MASHKNNNNADDYDYDEQEVRFTHIQNKTLLVLSSDPIRTSFHFILILLYPPF